MYIKLEYTKEEEKVLVVDEIGRFLGEHLLFRILDLIDDKVKTIQIEEEVYFYIDDKKLEE